MSNADTPSPTHPERPSSSKLAPALIVGLTLVAGAAGAYLVKRAAADVNKVALASEPKGVTTVRAARVPYQPVRRYVGRLEPFAEARLGPQLVSAFVETVLVRPGDRVRRGDVLATLDCRSPTAAEQALASEARALAAKEKLAREEARRLAQLGEGGFVAEHELDKKNVETIAKSAELAALRSRLAGRSLERGDCVLHAPFDGEVGARFVDPGAFVRPGTPVLTVIDRSSVRVVGDVPEVDYAFVEAGREARLELLATGERRSAPIRRRVPSADHATRTARFEVDLSGAPPPTGTTARIEVDAGAPLDAIAIPLVGARVRGSKASLFVVEGGLAKSATARVLGERGSMLFLEPSDVLREGVEVVTEGRGQLSNGDRVVPKGLPAASASGSARPPGSASSKPSAAPSTSPSAKPPGSASARPSAEPPAKPAPPPVLPPSSGPPPAPPPSLPLPKAERP